MAAILAAFEVSVEPVERRGVEEVAEVAELLGALGAIIERVRKYEGKREALGYGSAKRIINSPYKNDFYN